MVRKIGIYKDPRNKLRPWVVRWFGEYDPSTGKQSRYTKSFKLKTEAEEFVAGKTTDFKRGQKRDRPDEITLKNFCADWLKSRKAQFRPGTTLLYKNTFKRLLDYFGPAQTLSKITPIEAAMFIGELKPLKTKIELSNSTRHRVLRNCRTMFGEAVTWQLISKNPFKKVKAPKCTVKRWHYLKADEYKRLLKAAPSLRWKALYALAYTGGLRYGEMFNLTWADIDLEKGHVTIQNRMATETMPPFYVKDNEKRTVPLPSQTLKILKQLQQNNPARFKVPYILLTERQYKGLIAKWVDYQKRRRAWMNKDMTNNVLTNFKRHVKKAKIEPDGQLAIHTLRKSCIQTWADYLPPNTTKELAGHSDLATTMRYYAKVDNYHRAKAAEIMEKWLDRKIG